MQDTWWGKVIDFFGGELLVNNSWSGSRVTRLPNNDSLFPSGCSDERTDSLHINSVKPAVIIIYLGTNDWAFGADKFYVDNVLDDVFHCVSFDFAYSQMLLKIKRNYPDAEIWCCTLNTTFISANPSFKFPYKYGGTHIEEYNQIIKETVDMNNCKIIDLYSYHIPYDSIDGSHPNADGMNTLATLMIKQIGGNEVNKFMYFELEKETEKFNNIFCSHCGNEVKHSENFCVYCGKLLNEQYLKFEICPNCHQRGMMYSDGFGYCVCCSFNVEPVGWDDMLLDVVIEQSNKVKQLAMTAKKSLNSLGRNTNSTDDNVFDSSYIWSQSSMNIDDIKCFGLSFGDCPNINISFDGDKLIVCNRINSCDGLMNFLDDKTVNLTYEQRINIIDYLRSIDFSTWKTSSHTIEMLKLGFDGFYVSESFAITFNNGYTFVCHNPEYEEFKQLIDLLKSFCDNSWFETYYREKVDDGTVLLEETSNLNTDYVFLPSDMTRLLFDNTMKLYDTDTNQNIEIQSEKIDVGRNSKCDIHIDNNYISQIHASFYHEDSCWFIMDQGSRNGTWLNDKKLALNTRYELYPSDIINFAKTKEYVFYKSIEDKGYKYNNDENSYEIKIGTLLNDRYELLKQIGSGGLSTVYLARDIRLNKMWAVKVVKAKRNNQSNPIFNSVIQEAQMMKSFSHPAIPNIIDIVACQNFVAIVMEYVEGETLETIVKKYGAQPADRVVDWAKQICDVLGYLHTFNPSHIYRDMKPANVLLQPNGNIKIINFSIVRTYDLMKDCDTCFLGTRGYAAPEQFGGRGQSDARTDIYGLGMTTHHLLTGCDPAKPPYETRPICQRNPDLPKGLEYIVNKCIQLDPANRYQSCVELQNDLDRYEQLPPKKSFFDKIFKH